MGAINNKNVMLNLFQYPMQTKRLRNKPAMTSQLAYTF